MSKTTDYLILVAEHPMLAKWQRTVARDADGVSYAPAEITGRDEAHVFFCAIADGIQPLRIEGHSYYPTAWLKETYDARCVELCCAIERHLDEAARRIGQPL
jgi:hypothetical protein